MSINSFPKPLTKHEKWLECDREKVLQQVHSNPKILSTVNYLIQLSTPVLKKTKSGFIAETGDIQSCLLVHFNDSGPESSTNQIKVEVCHIDDDGQLVAKLTETEENALQLIRSFLIDFPDSVITTQNRKPIILFTSRTNDEDNNADTTVIGKPLGYLTLTNMRKIIESDYNKITVGVP